MTEKVLEAVKQYVTEQERALRIMSNMDSSEKSASVLLQKARAEGARMALFYAEQAARGE